MCGVLSWWNTEDEETADTTGARINTEASKTNN